MSVYMCALHHLVPPTVWNASLNRWWRLKQSIQLVHVPLSNWHNAMFTWNTTLVKCATIRRHGSDVYLGMSLVQIGGSNLMH